MRDCRSRVLAGLGDRGSWAGGRRTRCPRDRAGPRNPSLVRSDGPASGAEGGPEGGAKEAPGAAKPVGKAVASEAKIEAKAATSLEHGSSAKAEIPPSPLSEYVDQQQAATDASIEGGTTLGNPLKNASSAIAGALAGGPAPGANTSAGQKPSPAGSAPNPEPDSYRNLWGLMNLFRSSPDEAPAKRLMTDQEARQKMISDPRNQY
jgi:hypothetical protein